MADADFHLELLDLRSVSETERESEALRLATEEAQRPFDLSRDLMLRACLLRLSGDEHVLVLTLHHIASDGWSLEVFWQELTALYGSFSAGHPSPLPELPAQYADYAVWQRQWLRGEVLDRQLMYWKERLAGAPAVLELPTDYPRPASRSYRGGRLAFTLSPELTAGLRELARREGVTLFMLLTAGFHQPGRHVRGDRIAVQVARGDAIKPTEQIRPLSIAELPLIPNATNLVIATSKLPARAA
jgi:hypothetical protein